MADLPTTPGAIIGYRRNGTPIRLIAGGSEAVPELTPAAEPTGDAGADTAAEAMLADAAATPDEPVAGAEGQEPRFDAAYVTKLREEAAANRVKARELEQSQQAAAAQHQEVMDGIARALGLKSDDAPPDPEELTRQLTAAQAAQADKDAELRSIRMERAAEKAARTHGGDIDALLDSRTFERELSKLDPTQDDFTSALDALVRDTVDSNPKYKAAGPAPAAPGADFSSGTGEQRTQRSTGLYAAFTNRYSGGG